MFKGTNQLLGAADGITLLIVFPGGRLDNGISRRVPDVLDWICNSG